jgi:CelD/BcsL family acetyltransferase involved in cellulose biosynthesis
MKAEEALAIEIATDADVPESEWWSLWERDPGATPFQSPAWLIPWRRHFPEGEDRVLVLRRAGRMVGLVPLYLHSGRLLLWGAGTSDWLDGLFDPELRPEELSLAVATLDRPLDLFQLAARSRLRAMPCPPGWSGFECRSEACHRTRLPAVRNERLAKNVRYCRRRAARAGIAGPVRLRSASADRLAELHGLRWREKGGAGIFADERMLAWQRDALPALEAAGLAVVWALFKAERPAAMLYLLRRGRTVYNFIGGFDPELSEFSPGSILLDHAMAEAEASGCDTFDFLRGDEPYKKRWGAAECPTFSRRLAPPSQGR